MIGFTIAYVHYAGTEPKEVEAVVIDAYTDNTGTNSVRRYKVLGYEWWDRDKKHIKIINIEDWQVRRIVSMEQKSPDQMTEAF